jgi:hypothetical protein
VADERKLAETGLHEALDRLRNRLAGNDPGLPQLSLFEALQWCYALDCHHKRHLKPTWRTVQEASPEGQTQAALIWARGKFTHRLINTTQLIEWSSRTTYTGGGGRRGGRVIVMARGGGSELIWKCKADLPGRQGDDQGDGAFYVNHVESRPILPPLEAAARFLVELD